MVVYLCPEIEFLLRRKNRSKAPIPTITTNVDKLKRVTISLSRRDENSFVRASFGAVLLAGLRMLVATHQRSSTATRVRQPAVWSALDQNLLLFRIVPAGPSTSTSVIHTVTHTLDIVFNSCLRFDSGCEIGTKPITQRMHASGLSGESSTSSGNLCLIRAFPFTLCKHTSTQTQTHTHNRWPIANFRFASIEPSTDGPGTWHRQGWK